MDDLDRAIVNALQDGIKVCPRPFLALAEGLGITEEALLQRVRTLQEQRVLTRFGPLFDAVELGGAFVLAALAVPEEDYERIASLVNAFPEVAHNYRREHALNMWFVLATEKPDQMGEVVAAIERATGLAVACFPKEAEYFLELKLTA